jgi:hypothetical protein
MRIEVAEQVAAPPAAVFARAADFDAFEAWARRRGLPVERVAEDPPAWRVGVTWRGLALSVDLAVDALDAPRRYAVSGEARGVDGRAAVEVVPGPAGSVLSVRIELRGRGVAGRMLMQPLRLARPVLEGRIRGALAALAAEAAEAEAKAGTERASWR